MLPLAPIATSQSLRFTSTLSFALSGAPYSLIAARLFLYFTASCAHPL